MTYRVEQRWQMALPIALAILGALHQGCVVAAPSFRDTGKVSIERWADVKGDDRDVAAILATFNHAEEALHRNNIDGVMALYSAQYQHHGLSKTELRTIWEEMLAQYDGLSSTHVFSRVSIETSGKVSTARVWCTGSLWGTSRATKEREVIDTWFYEIHHLVYEEGDWQILGHAGGETQTVTFGKSPHPFF